MSDSNGEEHLRKLLFNTPGKAIRLLFDAYNRTLISISFNLTRNRKAAEDIVQETFIHVYQNHLWLGQQHEKSIEHYLVRVVRNKSITYYKNDIKLALSKTKYFNDNRLNQIEVSPEDKIMAQEVLDEFNWFVSTFPPRERECFMMSRDGGMTNKQIAEKLNITVKAVERCITSANKRLNNFR